MPDTNVGAHIDIVRRGRVDSERVMLDIEQVGARRAVPWAPSRTVKPPDARRRAHPAEGDIYRVPVGVSPVHRDIGYQTSNCHRTGGCIIQLPYIPVCSGAVGAKHLSGGRAHEEAGRRGERHRKDGTNRSTRRDIKMHGPGSSEVIRYEDALTRCYGDDPGIGRPRRIVRWADDRLGHRGPRKLPFRPSDFARPPGRGAVNVAVGVDEHLVRIGPVYEAITAVAAHDMTPDRSGRGSRGSVI